MMCEICNNNELNNYCTTNICESCCKSMKCPIRYTCQAYPKILEELILTETFFIGKHMHP